MSETSTRNERILRSSCSIQEFRVDFLLEEEFACDKEFVRRFAEACKLDVSDYEVVEVAHSVTDRHGEADLVVILESGTTSNKIKRTALLIEVKITAGSQPDQAERYRRRGDDGIGKLWDVYRTVLVAPSSYVGEKDVFQHAVTLEEIQPWICADDPARAGFRKAKLEEAITKKNASGVQIVDPATTAFRSNYFYFLRDFNARHGTDFSISPPKPVWSGETWFRIASPTLPKWAKMRHKSRTSMKAATGLIELSFLSTDIKAIGSLKSLLEPGMILVSNGIRAQHSAIEIAVPELHETNPFEQERQKLEQALCEGERLWRFFKKNRDRIGEVVMNAQGSIAAKASATDVSAHP